MTAYEKSQFLDNIHTSTFSKIESPISAFTRSEYIKLNFPLNKFFAKEQVKNPFFMPQKEEAILENFGRTKTSTQQYSYSLLHQIMFFAVYAYAFFLLFSIVWNYFQVMFTSPGVVPDSWVKEEKRKRKLERKHTKLTRRWNWLEQNKGHKDVASLQKVLFALWGKLMKEELEVEQVLGKYREELAKFEEEKNKEVKVEGEAQAEEPIQSITSAQAKEMEEAIKLLDEAKAKQFLILFQGLNKEYPFIDTCVKQISEWESSHKEEKTVLGKHWSTHCSRCEQPKPERTHHCSACHKCVIKMDHHCPWIFNCVGLNNQRFFLGFLFYNLIACFSIAAFTLAIYSGLLPVFKEVQNLFISFIFFSKKMLIFCSSFFQKVYEAWEGPVFLIFTITLCLSPVLMGFFAWHFYLVISNQTTIEFQFNKFQQFDIAGRIRELMDETYQSKGFFSNVNEFDLGIKGNLNQCFGVPFRQISFIPKFFPLNIVHEMISSMLWLAEVVIPIKRQLPCNGLNFPKNQSKQQEEKKNQ